VEFAEEDEETGEDFDPRIHRLAYAWREERPDLASFLRKYAFVERDQFVVPSLILKTDSPVNGTSAGIARLTSGS
jgi:hypothetical protein